MEGKSLVYIVLVSGSFSFEKEVIVERRRKFLLDISDSY